MVGGSNGEAEQRGGAAPRSMGLRLLGWFWILLILGLAGGAAGLQVLGPPPAEPSPQVAPTQGAPSQGVPATDGRAVPAGAANSMASAPPPSAPGPRVTDVAFTRHAAGAPISPPDPALLAPSTQFPDLQLPRIAADGRMPMQVYAGGFDSADTRPKVALVLAGIGQSDTYSDDASHLLPAGVTFAVSPYANQPARLLDDIRAHGHEFLLSLPMEPLGAPLNDAGSQSLLTGASPAQNAQRLEWALTRFAGYVGATSALDGLRGERFSASPTQMDVVLDTLTHRGLLYVDANLPANRSPSPDHPRLPSRSVDIVIDDPAVRVEIERKLQALEQIARDRGGAIGLAGPPRPVTIDRIAAWTNSLAAHGIALAPVSVVVLLPPPTAPGPVPMTAGPVAGDAATIASRAGRAP
jgi:polysaccharide deacetylase 2 family uncharacterized protein YibQ